MVHVNISRFNGLFNFPHLCSTIPISPSYGVYISQLIRYAWACSTYNQFLIRGGLLTNKLMSKSRLQTAFSKFYSRYNDLNCQYNNHLGQIMLSDVFHTNRRLFFILWSWLRFPELELGLTTSVTGWHGMLTPPYKAPYPTSSVSKGRCLPYSQICIS